jgi:DMSO reductase anchor subunit
VEACPNGAIRITLVDQARAIAAAEANAFLPAAPAPGDTIPTTHYKTRRSSARNLLPADFYVVSPQHSHPALVLMLVFMQMAIGAYAVPLLWPRAQGALPSLLCGGAALVASLFHLGRPRYAFRAVLGLGTSWLSREIAAFSAFLGLCALDTLVGRIHWTTAAGGGMALACSIMVYAATQRPCWKVPVTATKFVLTALVLGLGSRMALGQPALACPLALAAGAKLLFELLAFRHLRDRRHSPERRSAILMTGDLRSRTVWRFVLGLLGGILLPMVLHVGGETSLVAWGALALCLGGELLERHLFFAAATAPRMPGALR